MLAGVCVPAAEYIADSLGSVLSDLPSGVANRTFDSASGMMMESGC